MKFAVGDYAIEKHQNRFDVDTICRVIKTLPEQTFFWRGKEIEYATVVVEYFSEIKWNSRGCYQPSQLVKLSKEQADRILEMMNQNWTVNVKAG